MKINFDELQDEIIDIQDERNHEDRVFAQKINQFLKTRKNNRFDFSEIKEAVSRNVKPTIAYFNHEDGMGWLERYQMNVNYIQYYPNKNYFEAVGTIDDETDTFVMNGRDMDLESLYNLIDWLAQYQREQNGTARTPEQIEHERIEEEFGKEYFSNETYRHYIDTQLDPEELLMLALYNTAKNKKQRNKMPMTPRTKFAIILRRH